MFSSVKGRLVACLAAALLLFTAGSGVTIFKLYSETSRFESLNRDAVATASDRVPLLGTLTRIQTNVGKVRQRVLESIVLDHVNGLGQSPDETAAFADSFWIDTGVARRHAENLGLTQVVEGIDAIEMIFPLFYDASIEMTRAYTRERRNGIDAETMLGIFRLGSALDGTLDQLPAVVEQITQQRLSKAAERAAIANRSNTVLLRAIVVVTVVGGFLALAGSVYLFLMAMHYQRLKTERDGAEVATRAKSEFLATMSHELRTPLNAVIGFSEVLMSEAFGPVGSAKYRDYAKDINDSGQHLLSLINDILDLSKVESGEGELHEDDIEILDITKNVLMLVKGRAHQGRVVLETDLAEELPMLRADERKLKQILVNLLSNAIKFTEAGGKVRLRAWCQEDSCVFQIADTGIGIALEDIPKALSQFGQVDGNLNRRYEGTGLGLPLTKALVELHGGSLDLQSQVGTGTTVTVRFPAERTVALLDNSGSLDVSARAAS